METSREFFRTPRRLPPCSDVSVLQKTRMSHFWDTHHISTKYCCLPNFGRCGRSQDRVSVNCPLVERIYLAEWMAENLCRTVHHPF